MNDVELGDIVTDIVTGFRGLVIARITKLFGGPELEVLPQKLDDDGTPARAIWFEESRLQKD